MVKWTVLAVAVLSLAGCDAASLLTAPFSPGYRIYGSEPFSMDASVIWAQVLECSGSARSLGAVQWVWVDSIIQGRRAYGAFDAPVTVFLDRSLDNANLHYVIRHELTHYARDEWRSPTAHSDPGFRECAQS